MQSFDIHFIKKETVGIKIVATSLDEAIKLAKEGDIDLSDAKEIDGSNEIYFYEATPINNFKNWQLKTLYDAVYYEFINKEDFETAESIIQNYTNDFDLLESEKDEKSIGYKLALASQI